MSVAILSAATIPDLWEMLRKTRDPVLASTLGVRGTDLRANLVRGSLARLLDSYETQKLTEAEKTSPTPEPAIDMIPMLASVLNAGGDLSRMDAPHIVADMTDFLGFHLQYGYPPWEEEPDERTWYDPLDHRPYQWQLAEATGGFTLRATTAANTLEGTSPAAAYAEPRYATVVFLQGDDAYVVLDKIYNHDASLREAVSSVTDTLVEFDDGGREDLTSATPPWGTDDDTHMGIVNQNTYVLAWNPRIGYVSLNRVYPPQPLVQYQSPCQQPISSIRPIQSNGTRPHHATTAYMSHSLGRNHG